MANERSAKFGDVARAPLYTDIYTDIGAEVRPSFRPNPQRWLSNWPFKLAALVLAIMLWFFVRTDESLTGQRTLNVPVTVVGLDNSELASGVPERVAVTIYGPSTRVDALRTEGVDAFVDLQDVSGEFNVPVNVFPPQGLTLVRVAPTEIIGRVQSKTSKRVPVRVALYGPTPADALVQRETRPGEVIVTGLSSQVERVQAALAPVTLQGVDAPVNLYAADGSGQPVREVRLEPNQVRVTLSREEVLHTRRVPLNLTLPDVSPLEISAQSLSQSDVLLAGPKEVLISLERVPASVNPSSSVPRVREYTQALTLQLPEGVRALETPRLELQLSQPPSETSTGGAEDAPPETQSQPEPNQVPNQNP